MSEQYVNVKKVHAQIMDAFETALEVIETENAVELPDRTKWISVKDRLPEGANVMDVAENVIAYLNNGNGNGQVCTGWLCGKTWWLIVGQDDEHTRRDMGDVSHWMPLPEPPRD